MSWPAVASILSRLGVRITYLGNNRLDIRGVSRDELVAIAPHKWHLMACLILGDVADPERREHLRFIFEERAAVHEFDGGMSQTEAERLALQTLRAELRRRWNHDEDR